MNMYLIDISSVSINYSTEQLTFLTDLLVEIFSYTI